MHVNDSYMLILRHPGLVKPGDTVTISRPSEENFSVEHVEIARRHGVSPFVLKHLLVQGKEWSALFSDLKIKEGDVVRAVVEHRGVAPARLEVNVIGSVFYECARG